MLAVASFTSKETNLEEVLMKRMKVVLSVVVLTAVGALFAVGIGNPQMPCCKHPAMECCKNPAMPCCHFSHK